jgi:hypothetical protein
MRRLVAVVAVGFVVILHVSVSVQVLPIGKELVPISFSFLPLLSKQNKLECLSLTFENVYEAYMIGAHSMSKLLT